MYVGAQFVGGILGSVGTWIAFILVFVVISVATDERGPAGVAPLAVGFALACGVLIAGPVTGGSVNPARTLGRALVARHFDAVWFYIVGPIAGGVLAALLYYSFIPEAETLIREHGRLPFRKLN
jgi:glycerol uptake facilitator-like aquaporin